MGRASRNHEGPRLSEGPPNHYEKEVKQEGKERERERERERREKFMLNIIFRGFTEK